MGRTEADGMVDVYSGSIRTLGWSRAVLSRIRTSECCSQDHKEGVDQKGMWFTRAMVKGGLGATVTTSAHLRPEGFLGCLR